MPQTNRLIFRCDGACLPEIGTGHVVRDIEIANALVAKGACQPQQIAFVTRRNGPFVVGYRLLEQSPYGVIDVADEQLEWNTSQEASFLSGLDVQVLIVDRLKSEAEWMVQAKKGACWTVSLDDVGSGAVHADLVINGILHCLPAGERCYVGYDYLFLNNSEQPSYSSTANKGQKEGISVAVSFGGYDNRDLTGFFLQSLLDADLVQKNHIRLELLVGQESGLVLQSWRELIERLQDQGWKEVHLQVRAPNYFKRLLHADLAVVSGGLTVFEAISAGVPVIGLPQYPHQLETLQRLESKRAVYLGSRGMKLDTSYFSRVFSGLCNMPGERLALAKRGPELIDGNGRQRVIGLLLPFLNVQ